ncbi:MAG: type II secretion system F family protein [Candidatus Diapherotrites archaeon]|uniref:Type II secretion system F family protein n=1 Tax=Candidatus Iainarchaeum sp. TaxID=3101447 RepID=A0A8T4KZB9_9ARCH|nr:type II secretion system F family protein [Candidatus Diapherotrites archaeon]
MTVAKKKKKLMIPFSPFPLETLRKLAGRFLGIGEMFAHAFPYLELQLKQAEIDLRKEEYGAIIFFLLIFYFAIVSALMYFIAAKFAPKLALLMALTVGGVVGFLVLIQLGSFPAILVKRKVRDIERNLVFALRAMLIEIKSGVSLFDSLNMIAQGDYGAVSLEFKQAVEEIDTGTSEEEALQKIATQNPSLFFRKAIWQLVSGMKAGADVSIVMQELVATIGKEQRIEINRYGGSLRLLSLIYMMMGVIMPAMGLTLLIVMSSFPQIKIVNEMFWGLLAAVIIMQFMYLGFLKSKRPNLLG